MRRRGFLKLVLGAAASVVGGFYGWRPDLPLGRSEDRGLMASARHHLMLQGAHPPSRYYGEGFVGRLIEEHLNRAHARLFGRERSRRPDGT